MGAVKRERVDGGYGDQRSDVPKHEKKEDQSSGGYVKRENETYNGSNNYN